MHKCSVEGCVSESIGRRGYCSKHYQRWRRHGDPTAGRAPNGAGLALMRKSLERETDECIDWPFGKTNGYSETQYDGEPRAVHALVCELKNGPKPTDHHEAAHSCGRRQCINHRHLRWAVRAENVADTIRHGTISRGEKRPNARLREEDVREIRRLRGEFTQDDLADRFGVHRAHIKDIQMGRRWAWLQ